MSTKHDNHTPQPGRETAEWVLDVITRNPDCHDQGSWQNEGECGTTRCVAGWAAHAHGYRTLSISKFVWAKGDKKRAVDSLGKDLLHLSPRDANRLFYTSSDAQAVEALRYVAKGEPINWAAVWGDGDE